MNVHDLKNSFQYAMHGNGAYKGLRQTNTLDAMLYWYGRGVHIFEIDMARTSDDRYVAVAHTVDRKSMIRLEIPEEPRAYDYGWFMSQKLFPLTTGGLTPLSLESIVEFLEQHMDCVIMLDLFGFFTEQDIEHFLDALDPLVDGKPQLRDRLLLEAYNRTMSRAIFRRSDSYCIIYCARYEGNQEKDGFVPVDDLLEYNISFVSYPWMYHKLYPSEIKAYVDAGFTVFSRTRYNFQDRLLKAEGVSVNIVAYRFDGLKIMVQWPLYMLSCIRRMLSKWKMKKLIGRGEV